MEYQMLERWTRPDNFIARDDSWVYSNECFVFLGRNRGSDHLMESNFHCAIKEIGGESDTVRIVKESHWACGWIEWIAIHESDTKALQIADDILCALSDYPVLSEDDFIEREWNAAQGWWEQMQIEERIDLCKGAGISIFAARRDYIPQEDNGYIYEYCLA